MSKSGYVFSPASLAVTVEGAAVAPASTASACSADGWCWENPLSQGNPLEAVWARSATDAWAVGTGGTALHWDGSAWSKVTSGTTVYELRGIWGTSATDLRAVGDFGMVLRYRP
ncbi:MAG TPA: hypothetical protein VF912_05775 [Anaeromyxobacter sp.]